MKKNLLVAPAAVMVGILACAPAAAAVDSFALEASEFRGSDMVRAGVQWNMKQRWLEIGDWHLGSYWDLGLAHWHRNATVAGQNENLVEIGLMPVLRFQQNSLRGLYAEVGLGLNLLSHTRLGDRGLGLPVQLGSGFGVGLRFGDKGQYDMSARYDHLSNGRLKQPNQGADAVAIRLRYHF